MTTKFRINSDAEHGFCFQFMNGWVVSVQWGPGNYGSNKAADYGEKVPPGQTAEVGIWHSADDPLDTVLVWGWQTPEQVSKILAEVSAGIVRAKEPEAGFSAHELLSTQLHQRKIKS